MFLPKNYTKKLIKYRQLTKTLSLSPLFVSLDKVYLNFLIIGNEGFDSIKQKQKILKLTDNEIEKLEQEYNYVLSCYSEMIGKDTSENADSCSDASVGTENADSCSDASVGTENVNSCSDASVGTENVNSCSDASVGTENVNSCSDASVGTENATSRSDASVGTENADFCSDARNIIDGEKTTLIRAVEEGDVEMVKTLIPHEKGLRDFFGRSALMIAAEMGNTEIVELLIPHEAGINDGEKTALMRAAQYNRIECVELLIPYEKRLRFLYKITALICAAEMGKTEIVKLLIPHEAGMNDIEKTALMYAAENGHFECVELLISHEKGARDVEGKSALMYAVENNHLECVKLLIPHEKGIKDTYEKTALMYAVENNHLECVKLLIPHEKGIRDIYGKTALIVAIENNQIDLIKILIPYEKDEKFNKKTPFMLAIDKDNLEIVKSFIDDIDTCNVDTCNVDTCNVDTCNVDTCNVDTRNLVNTNILNYAIKTFNVNSFELLISYIPSDTWKVMLKKHLFIEKRMPFIKIGSFVDILSRIIKTNKNSYEEMIKLVETLSFDKIVQYSKITNKVELEANLINDFSKYKQKIQQAIKDIKEHDNTCPICLDENIILYRNCKNCDFYACRGCWKSMTKCIQCNVESIKWKKCINPLIIKFSNLL